MIGILEGGPHDGTTFKVSSDEPEVSVVIAIDQHVYVLHEITYGPSSARAAYAYKQWEEIT